MGGRVERIKGERHHTHKKPESQKRNAIKRRKKEEEKTQAELQNGTSEKYKKKKPRNGSFKTAANQQTEKRI